MEHQLELSPSERSGRRAVVDEVRTSSNPSVTQYKVPQKKSDSPFNLRSLLVPSTAG